MYLFMYSFIYLLYVSILSSLRTHQKRASNLITDGCEPPCSCWDLNSGPLEEQSVLLTAEPSSVQPHAAPFLAGPACLWEHCAAFGSTVLAFGSTVLPLGAL